jgi:hypothetical protein
MKTKRARTVTGKFLALLVFRPFTCPVGRYGPTGCFCKKEILFGFCRNLGLGLLSIRFKFIDSIKLIHVIR